MCCIGVVSYAATIVRISSGSDYYVVSDMEVRSAKEVAQT